MKILKIRPKIDNPSRYNYQIMYSVWEEIKGDLVILEEFDKNLDNYDVVFLPYYKRWEQHYDLLRKIKEHKIKKVLFDDDCYNRSFTISFYDNIDFIFYRMEDINKLPPLNLSKRWKWSINTDLYTPIYGGSGVAFNCGIGYLYKDRIEAAKYIKNTTYTGSEYIKLLQNSAAAVHIDSHLVKAVQGKIIEFAACGTQIISNRTNNINDYFPDDLIIYFDSFPELKYIYNNFIPNIDKQKKLREICDEKHSNKIRAKEIITTLEKNL